MKHEQRRQQRLRRNRQTGKRAGGESVRIFVGPGTLLKYRREVLPAGEIHAEDRLEA